MTSSGNVIEVTGAGGGAGEAVKVTVPVPRTAFVEEFLAVTVMAVCVATVLGAL